MVLVFLFFSGCARATPVYNTVDPINTLENKKNISDEAIVKAIAKAGASLGWSITKIKDGELEGRLNIRAHMALITIKYDQKQYVIEYKDSVNLRYDPENNTIHKNYNGWIRNLEKAINTELIAL